MLNKLPVVLLQLLCSSLVLANPDPVPAPGITPAPIVERQDRSSRLIGYASELGSYAPYTCNLGYIWTTSGRYGKCCSTIYSTCNFITACSRSSFEDLYGTSSCATAGNTCNTDYVYKSYNDPNPILYLGCASTTAKLYFQTPPTGSVSLTRVPTTIRLSSRSTSTTRTASRTGTATEVATFVSDFGESSTSSRRKKSKLWIVGAVVGPIAGLAVIGLIVFIVLFLKNRKKKEQPPTQPPMYQQPPPSGPYSPQQGYGQQQNLYPQTPGSPAPSSVAPAYDNRWTGYYGQDQTGTSKQPYVAQQGVPSPPPQGMPYPPPQGFQQSPQSIPTPPPHTYQQQPQSIPSPQDASIQHPQSAVPPQEIPTQQPQAISSPQGVPAQHPTPMPTQGPRDGAVELGPGHTPQVNATQPSHQ